MSDFVYREPIQVLRDIIQTEMQLADRQVMLSNQKFEIPTLGLYIFLSYIGPAQVIARNAELVDNGLGGQDELQSIAMLHRIQVDLMAYNDKVGGNQARERKEEIAMAISSIYSQQQQEKYAMQIARHPGAFIDASFLEETEMMTRYSTTIQTMSVNRKQKSTNDYYSDFSRAVPPTLVVNA